MEEKLKPVVVDVKNVKPFGDCSIYESRMILDKCITGRDNVVQINHGTVKAGAKLGGAAHEEDEIYYILTGSGKLKLDEDIIDIHGGQVIFIPKGVFHALDNSMSSEDMTILTMWRYYQYNDAYQARMEAWGKSFKTVDED